MKQRKSSFGALSSGAKFGIIGIVAILIIVIAVIAIYSSSDSTSPSQTTPKPTNSISTAAKTITTAAKALVTPALAHFGWKPVAGEEDLVAKLRGLIVQLLAIHGKDTDAQRQCRDILFNNTVTCCACCPRGAAAALERTQLSLPMAETPRSGASGCARR